MFTLLVFILILSLLVLIHEWGHFYAAKKNGIRVDEFGFGIPPRIYGKKIGETLYSLNLLPFGGFVKLAGEDPHSEKEDTVDPEVSFSHKKPWQKAVVICAGVFMNMILAFVLYTVFFLFTGFKTLPLPMIFDHDFAFGEVHTNNTMVMDIAEDSMLTQTNLQRGESIIEINNTPVYSLDDIRDLLNNGDLAANDDVKLLVQNNMSLEKDVRTIYTSLNELDGSLVLGVYFAKYVEIDYSSAPIFAGIMHTFNMLDYSVSALGSLLAVSVENSTIEPISSSVSGPIGIFNVVDILLAADPMLAFLRILDLIALLSISLAFMNIIPFPALDGGRLIFIIYEMIFRKPINPKIESYVHQVGMLVLLALIILVTIKDFRMFY
jgi:regulator of sigma E protease